MRPQDLLALLGEFYRDKVALKARHEAGARRIRDYAANNAYQYLLDREEDHVNWLEAAIRSLDGPVAALEISPVLPATEAEIIREDIELEGQFYDRWAARLEAIDQARHRKMLQVILNEALEHKRFFEQAAAGRRDMIGRHVEGPGTGNGVMASRWVGD